MDYHSALKRESYQPETAPITRVEARGSVAFIHDIMTGPLPPPYRRCDVLYTDLPWRAGFKECNRRAGVTEARTYQAFLGYVGDIVENLRCLSVLITGRHAIPLLPRPRSVIDTRLNGASAVALVYHGKYPYPSADSRDILERLTTGFETVGDFCCGYGRTARAFLQAGKSFVVSDYNPRCIDYIARRWQGWLP